MFIDKFGMTNEANNTAHKFRVNEWRQREAKREGRIYKVLVIYLKAQKLLVLRGYAEGVVARLHVERDTGIFRAGNER